MQHAKIHVKATTYHIKHAMLTSNMQRTRIFRNTLYFWLYSRYATSVVKHATIDEIHAICTIRKLTIDDSDFIIKIILSCNYDRVVTEF